MESPSPGALSSAALLWIPPHPREEFKAKTSGPWERPWHSAQLPTTHHSLQRAAVDPKLGQLAAAYSDPGRLPMGAGRAWVQASRRHSSPAATTAVNPILQSEWSCTPPRDTHPAPTVSAAPHRTCQGHILTLSFWRKLTPGGQGGTF